MSTRTRTTDWPTRDRRESERRDLAILLGRGHSVSAAAELLGIPIATAYRWAKDVRR